MPTYGYRCQTCGSEFDVWQRMTDPPQAACPSCSGAGARLFFPASIVFKGSGFYKTDSRSGATANGSGAQQDGKPGAASEKQGAPEKAAETTGDKRSSKEAAPSDAGGSRSKGPSDPASSGTASSGSSSTPPTPAG